MNKYFINYLTLPLMFCATPAFADEVAPTCDVTEEATVLQNEFEILTETTLSDITSDLDLINIKKEKTLKKIAKLRNSNRELITKLANDPNISDFKKSKLIKKAKNLKKKIEKKIKKETKRD